MSHVSGMAEQATDPSLSIHQEQYLVVFGSYGNFGFSSRRYLSPLVAEEISTETKHRTAILQRFWKRYIVVYLN